MDAANVHNKLILAVVQEDDYDATVSELNQNGFFVTMLSSTRGQAEADRLLQRVHARRRPVRRGHALHPHEYGVRRRDRVRPGPGAAGKVLISQILSHSGGARRLRNFLFCWRRSGRPSAYSHFFTEFLRKLCVFAVNL